MRRFAWMGLVALAGLGGVACNDSLEGKEVFIANLSGAEEVPARSTAASGTAQIIVDGDQITYSIEVDDISSITAAHIHSGGPGTTGPIRLFLYPPRAADAPAPQVTTTEKRILVSATVPSSNVTGVTFQELLAQMRSNGAYVNVHTVQFGGGEIRGTTRPQ